MTTQAQLHQGTAVEIEVLERIEWQDVDKTPPQNLSIDPGTYPATPLLFYDAANGQYIVQAWEIDDGTQRLRMSEDGRAHFDRLDGKLKTPDISDPALWPPSTASRPYTP